MKSLKFEPNVNQCLVQSFRLLVGYATNLKNVKFSSFVFVFVHALILPNQLTFMRIFIFP
jgi:hypothetical protein